MSGDPREEDRGRRWFLKAQGGGGAFRYTGWKRMECFRRKDDDTREEEKVPPFGKSPREEDWALPKICYLP